MTLKPIVKFGGPRIEATRSVYRTFEPVVEELRRWDVVLMHGEVKLMGMASTHLPRCGNGEFGYACKCLSAPRITSSVVDEWKKPLRESWYSSETGTGEARHLLSLEDGDEVEVHSGKVYRLVGPRKVEGYDSLNAGSIWRVYAEEDARRETVAAPWWRRFVFRRGA